MTNKTNIVSNKILALSICAILTIYLFPFVIAQSNTALNAQASSNQPEVGSILTVTLRISNVENLAGIDATLQWNPSVLSLTNVILNLGDSYPNGVLHGSKINYNPDTLVVGDIFVSETKVSGSYNILAQSIGQATPGFTGSGTIATLSFNVKTTGSAALSLQTELANHPPSGQIADNIDHQDTADSVTAVPQGSSTSPTPTPTTSTSPGTSLSTQPSSTAPTTPTTKPTDNNSQTEYLLAIAGLLVAVIAVLAIFILRKRKPPNPT